jgi:hypothetical protein
VVTELTPDDADWAAALMADTAANTSAALRSAGPQPAQPPSGRQPVVGPGTCPWRRQPSDRLRLRCRAATDAGQVPTDAPASGVTVPSSAVHPSGDAPAAAPFAAAFRGVTSDRGTGILRVVRPGATVYDPGCPVPLADHVADGTDAWPTVRTPPAWRPRRSGSAPSYWSCPRFPARPGPESCSDPAGMWRRTGRSVGPSLIVDE